jgi:polysaccharide pyruvyl transferase WcaK-like protein
MRTRVSILGASLDVGNRGVLALGISTARLVGAGRADVEVCFHYGSASGGKRPLSEAPDDLVTVLNCRMSPRSRPSEHVLVILALACLYRIGIKGPARNNPWLRALIDADVIGDIRGGDSFSDIYGLRKFVEGSLPLLSVAILGRPYVMLPQTYGPFSLPSARRLAGVLLKRAKSIYTRDRNCAPLVRELCGRTPVFCPDVAFTLEAREPRRLSLKPSADLLEPGDLVVGLNVSGLLYMGGYTGRNMFGLRTNYRELIDRLVERLLSSTDAKVLLVPHVFGSEQEEEATAAILATFETRFPGRILAIDQPLSERELKWVIGRTNFFVGSRMHACIAALSQCVPAVGLAYSDKFLGVFESAGVGESTIDLRKASVDEVIDQTLAAFNRRADLQGRLREQIAGVRGEVTRTFRALAPATAS